MRPLKNAQFCSRSRKARILTIPLYKRDRHPYPLVFRGLEFEPDAEIGQKGAFFKGLRIRTQTTSDANSGKKAS